MNKRQVGAFWEEAVTAYLMRSGVNILERNYRCSRGEIDIIGFHRGCLVFEVKYRNDDRFGTALEAVGSAKQEKICRCADWYLWKHPAEGMYRSALTWWRSAGKRSSGFKMHLNTGGQGRGTAGDEDSKKI